MDSYKDDLTLYHHGIKGMHWGIRRYQNADGSLTAVGRKRYNKDSSNNQKSAEELRTIADDLIPFGSGWDGYKKNYTPEMRHRVTQAADLGLKALKEQHPYEDYTPGDNNWRSWFLFEDQTIGLGMISDMINRGYSLKKVSNIIDTFLSPENQKIIDSIRYDENGNYRKNIDPKYVRMLDVSFDITTEGTWDHGRAYKEFAKVCQTVKNKKG